MEKITNRTENKKSENVRCGVITQDMRPLIKYHWGVYNWTWTDVGIT